MKTTNQTTISSLPICYSTL